MKKFVLFIFAFVVLAGCVYEFDPVIRVDETSGLVVEGDILIGDTTRITLSSIEPLSGENVNQVRGWVWVEDDSGNEYHPEFMGSSNSFNINMTKASPDRQYRLRIRLAAPVNGNSTYYSSSWRDVQKAPAIDDFSYTYEAGDYNLDPFVHLWLSLSSQEGSGCFRWDFEEIWEYHADSLAKYYYDVSTDRVRSYDGEIPPLYWCWAYAGSTQAGLAIAKSTGGERISGYGIYDINRRDRRMQSMYYIKLKARNISEECYEYLHSIEVNSTSTGSLSQPDPSQIIGNITCDDDPLEVVYGYIEASRVSFKEMFIPSLYIAPADYAGELPKPPPAEGLGLMTRLEAYEMGLRPNDTPNHWVSKQCVECTELGGTKNKPSFWPTSNE